MQWSSFLSCFFKDLSMVLQNCATFCWSWVFKRITIWSFTRKRLTLASGEHIPTRKSNPRSSTSIHSLENANRAALHPPLNRIRDSTPACILLYKILINRQEEIDAALSCFCSCVLFIYCICNEMTWHLLCGTFINQAQKKASSHHFSLSDVVLFQSPRDCHEQAHIWNLRYSFKEVHVSMCSETFAYADTSCIFHPSLSRF